MDQKEYNRNLIEEFRATRDAADGPYANRPILLLTTIGAKSAQRRTTPVMYLREGERLFVVASNAGAVKHPDWYRNLVEYAEVTVELGSETFDAQALVLNGADRQQIWEGIVRQQPFFAEHQAKIDRQIPVIELLLDRN